MSQPYKLFIATVKLRFIRTLLYYGQFALSLERESPYVFSKFNTVTDTFYAPLSVCSQIETLSTR